MVFFIFYIFRRSEVFPSIYRCATFFISMSTKAPHPSHCSWNINKIPIDSRPTTPSCGILWVHQQHKCWHTSALTMWPLPWQYFIVVLHRPPKRECNLAWHEQCWQQRGWHSPCYCSLPGTWWIESGTQAGLIALSATSGPLIMCSGDKLSLPHVK